MRINTVPVDIYRQVSDQTSKKNQATVEKPDVGKAPKTRKITLPAINEAEIGSVKASTSPSLISGVLSSEEKTMLVRHFARFGDSQDSSQIYNPNARVKAGALTGIKLDVKG